MTDATLDAAAPYGSKTLVVTLMTGSISVPDTVIVAPSPETDATFDSAVACAVSAVVCAVSAVLCAVSAVFCAVSAVFCAV